MNRVPFEKWKLLNEDRFYECGPCSGIGYVPCSACKGEGDVTHEECHGEGCDFCEGEGWIECDQCAGEGEIECWYCDGDKTNARHLYDQQYRQEMALLSEWRS